MADNFKHLHQILNKVIKGEVVFSTEGTVDAGVLTTATVSVSPVITTVSTLIIAANAARLGLILFNQSANSIYLSTKTPAVASTTTFYILPTFTQVSIGFLTPGQIYTGAIYGIRNSGTGTVICTEFTA